MFNSELKQKVKELETAMTEWNHLSRRREEYTTSLEKKIDKLNYQVKLLEWKLENPPKYNIGQNILGGKVTKISIVDKTTNWVSLDFVFASKYDSPIQNKTYEYTIQHPKLGTITKIE